VSPGLASKEMEDLCRVGGRIEAPRSAGPAKGWSKRGAGASFTVYPPLGVSPETEDESVIVTLAFARATIGFTHPSDDSWLTSNHP